MTTIFFPPANKRRISASGTAQSWRQFRFVAHFTNSEIGAHVLRRKSNWQSRTCFVPNKMINTRSQPHTHTQSHSNSILICLIGGMKWEMEIAEQSSQPQTDNGCTLNAQTNAHNNEVLNGGRVWINCENKCDDQFANRLNCLKLFCGWTQTDCMCQSIISLRRIAAHTRHSSHTCAAFDDDVSGKCIARGSGRGGEGGEKGRKACYINQMLAQLFCAVTFHRLSSSAVHLIFLSHQPNGRRIFGVFFDFTLEWISITSGDVPLHAKWVQLTSLRAL